MEPVLLRRAAIEDAPHIVTVVNSAYRPAPGEEGWTHESALVTGSRIDLEQVYQAIESSTVLVAFYGFQLVGCVQIQAKGIESFIGMLAVLPSNQTAGLGKKLLAEAESYAQSHLSAQRLVLLVVTDRRELIDFYVRRGYEETGEFVAYPTNSGVGKPLSSDARLAVLHKSVNRHFT